MPAIVDRMADHAVRTEHQKPPIPAADQGGLGHRDVLCEQAASFDHLGGGYKLPPLRTTCALPICIRTEREYGVWIRSRTKTPGPEPLVRSGFLLCCLREARPRNGQR